MAQVAMKTEWDMSLTTPEFRLVLKALGGRLRPDEIEEARRLGDLLTQMRTTATESTLRSNQKLAENLRAAQTGTSPR